MICSLAWKRVYLSDVLCVGHFPVKSELPTFLLILLLMHSKQLVPKNWIKWRRLVKYLWTQENGKQKWLHKNYIRINYSSDLLWWDLDSFLRRIARTLMSSKMCHRPSLNAWQRFLHVMAIFLPFHFTWHTLLDNIWQHPYGQHMTGPGADTKPGQW